MNQFFVEVLQVALVFPEGFKEQAQVIWIRKADKSVPVVIRRPAPIHFDSQQINRAIHASFPDQKF